MSGFRNRETWCRIDLFHVSTACFSNTFFLNGLQGVSKSFFYLLLPRSCSYLDVAQSKEELPRPGMEAQLPLMLVCTEQVSYLLYLLTAEMMKPKPCFLGGVKESIYMQHTSKNRPMCMGGYTNGMFPCVYIDLHNTVTSGPPHFGESFDRNNSL